MYVLNSTGGIIRNDSTGSGYWNAPRGSRKHKGIDLTLPDGVGQSVLAPITGRFKRIYYPYSDDLSYEGGVFVNGDLEVIMYYFKADRSLVRKGVVMGQVLGVAQDCRLHYKNPREGDLPHIHLQVGKYGEVNPLLLM